MENDVTHVECRAHVKGEFESLLGGVLHDDGDTRPLPVHRDANPTVRGDVGLAEQSHLVTQHRVCQVVHNDLTSRSASHRLLAFHNHQAICHPFHSISNCGTINNLRMKQLS